jgi:hypothetical protein
MNAFKVELVFVNFDGLSKEELASVIENTTYPNRCISPTVTRIMERDIGEWGDDHPLNKADTFDAELAKLFYPPPSAECASDHHWLQTPSTPKTCPTCGKEL